MKSSIRLARIVFRVWRKIAPSMQERFQDFDTRMFVKNEMCPDFDWKRHINRTNSYFKDWGFNISDLDAAYYSRVSGVKAAHYVTRSMAVHYIYPYLDRYDFVPAYMDKNIQARLLGLPCEAVDVLMPENVICNSNGVFFDFDGNECSAESAADMLVSYGEDMMLKPSVETFGGRGVCKVDKGTGKDVFLSLFGNYNANFVFQKIVRQHPVLAAYNPSSVNTVRIVTYRKPDRSIKILYSCLRFGGEGSVMDNVCSGGGYTGIDIETGHLRDRKRYNYFIMDMPAMDDSLPDELPCWEKIKSAALALHKRLPQMDIIGWDFSLTPDEIPVLIEFNPRPGVGLQQAVGPMFSKEDLDELMERISKVNVDCVPLGIVSYPDKPGYRCPHNKFRFK